MYLKLEPPSGKKIKVLAVFLMLFFAVIVNIGISTNYQPRLQLTLAADQEAICGVYYDQGHGMIESVSHLNQIYHVDEEVSLFFPIQVHNLKKIRFDPIEFTGQDLFKISVSRISLKCHRFAGVIPFSLNLLSNSKYTVESESHNQNYVIPREIEDPKLLINIPSDFDILIYHSKIVSFAVQVLLTLIAMSLAIVITHLVEVL